jgi:hypothetical protein
MSNADYVHMEVQSDEPIHTLPPTSPPPWQPPPSEQSRQTGWATFFAWWSARSELALGEAFRLWVEEEFVKSQSLELRGVKLCEEKMR